jgi:hypothetical protein
VSRSFEAHVSQSYLRAVQEVNRGLARGERSRQNSGVVLIDLPK